MPHTGLAFLCKGRGLPSSPPVLLLAPDPLPPTGLDSSALLGICITVALKLTWLSKTVVSIPDQPTPSQRITSQCPPQRKQPHPESKQQLS